MTLANALRQRQARELARSAWLRFWWDRFYCGFCYGAGRMLGDTRRESMRVARKCHTDAKRRTDCRSTSLNQEPVGDGR